MDYQKSKHNENCFSKYKYLPMLKGIKDLAIPSYFEHKDKRQKNIVHIGLNPFFKGHLPLYIHNYLIQNNESPKWGIECIDLDHRSFTLRNSFKKQEYIYTFLSKKSSGEIHPDLIGTILNYTTTNLNSDYLITKLSSDETEILTLSLEKINYFLDKEDQEINFEKPQILHDLTYPNSPKTIWGIVLKSLKMRIKNKLKPLVVFLLEDINYNGNIFLGNLIKFAEKSSFQHTEQISKFIYCPNSISLNYSVGPVYDNLAFLFYEYGIKDECSVLSRARSYWIIEEGYQQYLPAFISEEVIYVSDIKKYFKLKNYFQNYLEILILLCNEVFPDLKNDPKIWNYLKNELIFCLQIENDKELEKFFSFFKKVIFSEENSLSNIRNLSLRISTKSYPILFELYQINSKLATLFLGILYIYYRKNVPSLFLSDPIFYDLIKIFSSKDDRLVQFFDLPVFHNEFFRDNLNILNGVRSFINEYDLNETETETETENVLYNYLQIE